MDIYIKYELNKSIFNTKKYQSIKSIIYNYLEINNISDNVENYFLDYNGSYLDDDYSLERYNIERKSILTLNKKIKGGTTRNRILTILFGVLIGLMPIFILPLGFIPLTAGLIKIIVEKSLNTICKYLVCTLGKVTLYSRIKIGLWVLKYTAFLLMIYVLMTFPIIIYCVSIKGHTILDNPKSMCGAINAGSLTGLILTSLFLLIYACFKFGDYFLKLLMSIFKLTYFTNTLINPYLQAGLKIYNKAKYVPIFAIPVLGEIIKPYFSGLTILLKIVNLVLNSVKKIGCQLTFDKKALLKEIQSGGRGHLHKRSHKHKDKHKKSDSNDDSSSNSFGVNDIICEPDLDQCCSAENYVFIGDSLSFLIDNGFTSSFIKMFKVFPAFVLIIEALYGAGLDRLGYDTGIYGPLYEQKNYLNRILEKNIATLSKSTVDLINTFLNNGDQQLIPKIKNALDTNLDIPVDQKKIDEANKIKLKIDELEERMIYYSRNEGAAYIVGGSLFKTIFKFIFVNVFCNVVTTAKTSEDVITKMGDISEMVDMLKAGSSTGIFICILYLLAIIVLTFCGLFDIF
jgi:hypothetical protein